MKYNFTNLKLHDIDGKEMQDHDIHKLLAKGLYVNVKDLDLVEIAIKINKGEEVEIDKVEAQNIKKFIESDNCTLFAFAKKALIDFLNDKNE